MVITVPRSGPTRENVLGSANSARGNWVLPQYLRAQWGASGWPLLCRDLLVLTILPIGRNKPRRRECALPSVLPEAVAPGLPLFL